MTGTSEPTTVTVERGVATITLQSLERRNAFSQDLLKGLLGHLQAAIDNDDVRVIVVTNAGTVFSAGADLKEDRSSIGPDDPTFFDVVALMDSSPKPIVGRIAGHAAGGGAAMAIAFDISVMSDDARIGITEARLGIAPVPVAGMLAHRMTPKALSEAFLAAEMMSANRAADLGMVSIAVPADQLDETVAGYVDGLMRGGPEALRVTKEVLQQMVGRTAEENAALAATLENPNPALASERSEGVAAFVDKRDPNWIH